MWTLKALSGAKRLPDFFETIAEWTFGSVRHLANRDGDMPLSILDQDLLRSSLYLAIAGAKGDITKNSQEAGTSGHMLLLNMQH
jgi:hypothetical protein